MIADDNDTDDKFFTGINDTSEQLSPVCRGSCFLSYTAESSHHLMAALTALCQEENITLKTYARSHVNKENEAKNYISLCLGKACERATQADPPPHPPEWLPKVAAPTWGAAKMTSQNGPPQSRD